MSMSPSRQSYVYYDARSAGLPAGAGSLNAIRKFGQGAGAALLMFSGADAIANGPGAAAAQPVFDLTSLNGVAESLATGGLNGPLQVIGAILIFLLAGKSIARILGLLAAGALLIMYLQGVTVEEAGTFVGHFMQRLAAAADAFLTVDVVN